MNRPARRLALECDKPASGLGVACWEAQADGVPCGRLVSSCADCDRRPGLDPEFPAPAAGRKKPGDPLDA